MFSACFPGNPGNPHAFDSINNSESASVSAYALSLGNFRGLLSNAPENQKFVSEAPHFGRNIANFSKPWRRRAAQQQPVALSFRFDSDSGELRVLVDREPTKPAVVATAFE